MMRRLIFAALCALALPSAAAAQVAVDAVTTDFALGSTGRTISHTTSGSNRYLAVCVGGYDGANFAIPSGVTFNGQALASLGTAANTFGESASLWGLALEGVVSTGAFDVVVTLPGSADAVNITILSTTGTHQTVSTGTYVSSTGSASPITVDATTAAANDLVFDCASTSGTSGTYSSITVGADQTQRQNQDMFGAQYFGLSSTQPGGSGGVMSWTYAGTIGGVLWAQAAIPLKPSAGGGGGSTPCALTLLGAGKCG